MAITESLATALEREHREIDAGVAAFTAAPLEAARGIRPGRPDAPRWPCG